MKCPGCQSKNEDDARFCSKCGIKLEISCPECGKNLAPDSNFCNKCGHKLTFPPEEASRDLSFDEKIAKIQRYLPEGLTEKILSQRDRIEGERKQVTVMFCDMEGFTALTERLGPEEAYSIMDDIYEILIHKVHDYEGTVNEMTGDGIVALFGAPIALEDAPQRAIRSAMAIHREMVRYTDRVRKAKAEIPPLRMRIGIHSGPLVVGALGNDLRVEFKAVGDTVNLASRMEELAQAGTTYVTEDTFRFTEGLFRFEALGAKELKGKAEPVNVYQVIAPSTRRTRFDVSAERGLTPFIGRERELELLLDGFERAKDGRGQAFSIVAEAGLGKSRLLYEFRKAVVNEDMTFLEGRCLSYSRGIAYHPIIDVLKSYFDVRETDDDLQIIEKVNRGLEILRVDAASTLPFLLELLSVEDLGHEKLSLSPEVKKVRIIEALRTILLQGSQLRTLVIAFEDLHWADKISEEVLRSFMESIAGANVLLLFSYRPEFVHAWGGKSFHSQLNLMRLSNRETLKMATHLLGTEQIDSPLEDLILRKTEGVPFFIEEFVRSLIERKVIEARPDRYSLAKDPGQISIPSTIQDVIMARVDSLTADAKELLQTGSVIDREFSYELIKRVAEIPEHELLACLSALRDSELLYERGVYPRSTYIFKHALTQEVTYNSLLVKRRKEIHEKIGEAMVELHSGRLEDYCELLAYHYVRSENHEQAYHYLSMAQLKATEANAVEEVKGYFDACMKLLDTMPDTEKNRERRIHLLVSAHPVFHALMRIPEHYEHMTRYGPLVERMDLPALTGGFYRCLAYNQYHFALYDLAFESAKRGLELSELGGDAEGVGHAVTVLQFSHLIRGDLERVTALKEEATGRLKNRLTNWYNLRSMRWSLLYTLGACAWLGRWSDAVKYGKEVLELGQLYSDNTFLSAGASQLAMVYAFKGELDRAIEFGEVGVERAITPWDKTVSQAILAWVMCRAGEWEGNAERLAEIFEHFRKVPMLSWLVAYGHMPVEGYLLAGQYDRARQTAQESVELAARCGAKWPLATHHRLLGDIAMKTDENDAAPHFEKAIPIFQEIKAENGLALAYAGMGRYHKQQGNLEEARKYLTDGLEIFERLGTLIEPDKVRKELAELPE
jgi:class 3 adenylate cyclase/tetratricopeptide (TPR) repeat protein